MSSCGVPLHRSEWSPINSKTKTKPHRRICSHPADPERMSGR